MRSLVMLPSLCLLLCLVTFQIDAKPKIPWWQLKVTRAQGYEFQYTYFNVVCTFYFCLLNPQFSLESAVHIYYFPVLFAYSDNFQTQRLHRGRNPRPWEKVLHGMQVLARTESLWA